MNPKDSTSCGKRKANSAIERDRRSTGKALVFSWLSRWWCQLLMHREWRARLKARHCQRLRGRAARRRHFEGSSQRCSRVTQVSEQPTLTTATSADVCAFARDPSCFFDDRSTLSRTVVVRFEFEVDCDAGGDDDAARADYERDARRRRRARSPSRVSYQQRPP